MSANRPATKSRIQREIKENTLPYFYVSGVAGWICVGVPSVFLNHLECLKNIILAHPTVFRNFLTTFIRLAARDQQVQNLGYSGLADVMIGSLLNVVSSSSSGFIEGSLSAYFRYLLGKLISVVDHPQLLTTASRALGRAISCIAIAPLELTRVRRQTVPLFAPNAIRALYKTAALHGPLGIYAGLGALLTRSVTNTVVHSLLFGRVRVFVRNSAPKNSAGKLRKRDKISAVVVASSVTGVVAAIFSSPADVVFTRVAASPEATLSLLSHVQNIYSESGILGFFRGISMRCFILSLTFGFQSLMYSVFKEATSFSPHSSSSKINDS